ncbi:MAG TPA: L-threonylcarbamoyladenylate synthase [Bacteroidia bacterium]|nr:L-threonylcarbamoyladenylate synthase [Bacteroidia bacterium]
MSETGQDTGKAAELLKAGKLVAIPTETVYGLAAIATDSEAVLSVFEAKKRPRFDPLIIHVHSLESVSKYAVLEDKMLKALAAKFWPGPLTLLLPKKPIIPDLVSSGLNRVAVRIPNHSLTLELLKKLDAPLAAPSANPFGYVSPTRAEHVQKQLGDQVSYILDGGPCGIGLESTIAGVENGQLCIYRLGGLSLEDIKACCGSYHLILNESGDPSAPGQLKSHYSPMKALDFGPLPELLSKAHSTRSCLILFGKSDIKSDERFEVMNLSESGDMREAARNLFALLRQADESDCGQILCEKLPDTGLGRAINDRLKRAAAKD